MTGPAQPPATAFGVPVRVWALMVLQVGVAEYLARTASPREPKFITATHFAFAFAQAALLGQCIALCVLSLRSVGAAALGLGCLLFMHSGIAFDRSDRFLLLLGVWNVAIWMSVVGVILHAYRVQLRNLNVPFPPPPAELWRFSIPQLMLIISIVAVGLGSFIWLRQFVIGGDAAAWFFVVTLALLPGTLLALWTALGRNSLLARAAITIVTAATIGLLISPIFEHRYPIWFWPYLSSAQAAITLLSLLVVRSCGYRLLQSTSDDAAQASLDWALASGRLESEVRFARGAPSQFPGEFGVHYGIWLLITVHLAVTILLATYVNLRSANFSSAILLAFLFAQAALLGQSAGLSTLRVRNMLGAALGAVGLLIVAKRSDDGPFFIIGLSTLAVCMLTLGAILQVCGVTLRHLTDDASPPLRRWRFSLSQLFVLTTAMALIAAAVSSMRSIRFHTSDIPLMMLVSLTFAPGSLLALWAALGSRSLALGSLLTFTVTAALNSCVMWMLNPTTFHWLWIIAALAQAGITLLSLLVVRTCGYRLVCWRRVQQATSG